MLEIMLRIVVIVIAVLAALFVLSLIIYFFNLDMKAASVMERIMRKHYDKMKRNRKF